MNNYAIQIVKENDTEETLKASNAFADNMADAETQAQFHGGVVLGQIWETVG